jgi:hypothetical protein
MRNNGIAVNCMKPVGGIETPGLLFGRAPGQVGGRAPGSQDLPPPDSYVEAAVLLAMQTAETGTGIVMNDAQIINRFADDETKERLRKLNPPNWGEAMNVPVPQNNQPVTFQRRQEATS